MYCWMGVDKINILETVKYNRLKNWNTYCGELVCIRFWNPGIALFYHKYGKWGGLQITISPLTFTFLGLTVRKENWANINIISKNATNPKEDAKLLQGRLGFQWPILEFVFFWNGLSPAIFHRLKNPWGVKQRKLPFQHQCLSCVFLSSFPQLSLLIHSPWWKTVSIS